MSLTKNSLWNISGYIVPSIITIPSIGFLSRNLGMEQFGLFTLAYSIIGYATIFDLGLTRAVIFNVSINRKNSTEISKIIGTALYTAITLSITCAVMVYFCAENICQLLNVSQSTTPLAISTFKILSFTIPPLFANFIFFAFLEGTEQFSVLNIQKSITSTIIAAGPIIGYTASRNLLGTIFGLAIARTIAAIISYKRYLKYSTSRKLIFSKSTLKKLVKFGGWITISNIISPLMTYFDRFILSNIAGAKIVAYYTAPADAINKLAIIPGSITSALFPKISFDTHNRNKKTDTKKISITMTIILSAIAIPLFAAAPFIMKTWMGQGYEGMPSTALRILLIGFIFNSLAYIPYTTIQANSKSKITALVHAFEVIPYLTLLYFLINKYAVLGAATAWTVRVIIDYFVLSYMSMRITCNTKK